MTDEPINDPKLEMLLLDSLCEQADKSVRSYTELLQKMGDDLLAQATGLAKLFLQANPHILKFGFETTEGEYNDNGYSGYCINEEALYTHAPDMHIPEVGFNMPDFQKELTGNQFCTYKDHEDHEFLPPNEWDYDRVNVQVEQEKTLSAITNILYAVSDILSARYGTGVLSFSKDGMFINSD